MTDYDEWVPSGMYKAVLDVDAELLRTHPEGVNIQVHGLNAWHRLTDEEKAEWLPQILAAFVTRVHDEEHSRHLQRDAEDTTHTYLQEYDFAIAWDCAMNDPDANDEVRVCRDSLRNVLCELELLQHRLKMRDESS